MAEKLKLSRITIDLPKEDHKKLKTLAAITGKSMREIVMTSLQEHIKNNKIALPEAKETK